MSPSSRGAALRKETGSDAAWEEAFAEGARLSLEEAVKVALA